MEGAVYPVQGTSTDDLSGGGGGGGVGGGGSTLILSLMVVGSYPPWMDGLACPLLPEALGGLVQLVRVVGELFLKALAHMFLFVGQSFLSCNNKKMC